MQARFEWDPNKASVNFRKHGVSFPTAAQVFTDPFALIEQDRVEDGELRWQVIGLVDGSRMLFVAHTVHEDKGGDVIRIISARAAARKERKRYEDANG